MLVSPRQFLLSARWENSPLPPLLTSGMRSRSLSPEEERHLIKRVRKLEPRDRALITAQLFLGFRISEILSLAVGHVLHNGRIRERVSLPPRFLKGGYGGTRSVPIGPELRRALERYLVVRSRKERLEADAPLFLSRERGQGRAPKALCRSSAEKLIKGALIAIAPNDPQGLSTHALRKTFASRIYEDSGHDLLCVREALGHSSVAVTQLYLPVNRGKVDALILKRDRTRKQTSEVTIACRESTSPAAASPKLSFREELASACADEPAASLGQPEPSGTQAPTPDLFLPGFEGFAA